MNKPQLLACILALHLLVSLQAQPYPDSWTHFRGNHLNGISTGSNLALNWNDSLNISWKYPDPGKGWSSPVILGKQLWVTTATARGKEMRAICLDTESGNVIFNKLIFEPDSLFRIHAVNSYATPTPAIEEGSVYVHFGRYGTACLDTESGETLWKRSDLQCEHIQGPGSSLLIHRDKLIVHMEGSDVQYILALDKHTGKTLWRIDRPAEVYDRLEYIGKKAYITPIVIHAGGRELLISNGAAACIAYDPETGQEVWRIVRGEDSTISMPVESNGILYFYTGFVTDSAGNTPAYLLAVNPDGEGDIGLTNVIWETPSPRLQLLTPLVKDGLLYTINSEGRLLILDALSGEELFQHRLKGKFHSSPVYADGHIYFSSTRGTSYVLKEGLSGEIVSENKTSGEIWASPAITGKAMYLRSSKYLYKISLK